MFGIRLAMALRFSCVAFVSLSSFLTSVAFRIQSKQRNSTGKVVTLGDSCSSGTGLHAHDEDYEGGPCWRDLELTPGALLAKADNLVGINNACKGAGVQSVFQQFEEVKASNPADVAAGWAGSTILFTVGSNEILTRRGQKWTALLTECLMSIYGKCHEDLENEIVTWDLLQARVTELYTKIAQDAPNARIRVLGYPRLMNRNVLCIAVPGLDWSAGDWMDRQADELNRRLRLAVEDVRSRFAIHQAPAGSAALPQEVSQGYDQVLEKLLQKARAKPTGGAAGSLLEASLRRKGSTPAPAPPPPPAPPSAVDIQFVDIEKYLSRGACRLFSRDVNSLVFSGFSISDASFHPSQRGYGKYYEALGASLGRSLPVIHSPADMSTVEENMHIFEGWDTNKNGKLEVDEVVAMAGEEGDPEVREQLRALLLQVDKDQDGALILAEFEELLTLAGTLDEAQAI